MNSVLFVLMLGLALGLAGVGRAAPAQKREGRMPQALRLGVGHYVPRRAVESQGATFYVSPQGDDSLSGRAARRRGGDGPFATVARAQEAVRALKAHRPGAVPFPVYLRGGRYALDRPLVFTPDDSGSSGAPVTYAAYRGETPVLSGGRAIAGWKRGEGGLWTAEVPGVEAGAWPFRQLFVNGNRRQRARLPSAGYYRMDGELSEEERSRFKFHPGEIRKEWAARGDVEVMTLARWVEARMPIREVDEATRTVTLAGKASPWAREPGQRYYVENAPEGLDAPGSWYLDRAAGIVSYRPLPGEAMDRARVVAPVLDTLVRLRGDPAGGRYVHDLRLRGLTFSEADWTMGPNGYADTQAANDIPAALEAEGAAGCAVERCRFIHLGRYAVEFGRGCKSNRIVGCEMTDLGAGGVKIGEPGLRDDEAEQSGGNVISDNRIHDIGIVYPAAVGIWVGQSGGNRIAHNAIYDTDYTAISVGWTWGYGRTLARDNIIEYNHAYRIGRGVLSDMGAIYTLGVQPGSIIRNNLFHDVSSDTYGGWGIYPDEGSSGLLIENNVVYRTKTGGFHQHYGQNNIVRNNIFALAREGQIIRTRQEDHVSFTFERNIVYWADGPLLGGDWKDDDTFRIDGNLYWREGGQPFDFAGASLEEWRKRGHDVDSIVADPRFVDPGRGDFRLKPGSPAFRLGFRPIDLSGVGPRKGLSPEATIPSF